MIYLTIGVGEGAMAEASGGFLTAVAAVEAAIAQAAVNIDVSDSGDHD